MIAAHKDVAKTLSMKSAGATKGTPETAVGLKANSLETSFKVSFQRELNTYQTNNQRLFPRHKLSATIIEQSRKV